MKEYQIWKIKIVNQIRRIKNINLILNKFKNKIVCIKIRLFCWLNNWKVVKLVRRLLKNSMRNIKVGLKIEIKLNKFKYRNTKRNTKHTKILLI